MLKNVLYLRGIGKQFSAIPTAYLNRRIQSLNRKKKIQTNWYLVLWFKQFFFTKVFIFVLFCFLGSWMLISDLCDMTSYTVLHGIRFLFSECEILPREYIAIFSLLGILWPFKNPCSNVLMMYRTVYESFPCTLSQNIWHKWLLCWFMYSLTLWQLKNLVKTRSIWN